MKRFHAAVFLSLVPNRPNFVFPLLNLTSDWQRNDPISVGTEIVHQHRVLRLNDSRDLSVEWLREHLEHSSRLS